MGGRIYSKLQFKRRRHDSSQGRHGGSSRELAVGHYASTLSKSELEVEQGYRASRLSHRYPLMRLHLLRFQTCLKASSLEVCVQTHERAYVWHLTFNHNIYANIYFSFWYKKILGTYETKMFIIILRKICMDITLIKYDYT